MAANGTLSKGITLSYKNASSFVELPDLQEIPELGGDVEKVEVTTLNDGARRYINGIKDYGDLAFTFLYGNSANDSFRVLTGLEQAGTSVEWQVELPDGTMFTFSGFASVKLASAGVNTPLTFTLSISLQSDIAITNPA